MFHHNYDHLHDVSPVPPPPRTSEMYRYAIEAGMLIGQHHRCASSPIQQPSAGAAGAALAEVGGY
jgi:hypothetical protein